jgi:hypothetical protein
VSRPDLPAWGLAALGIAAITLLGITGHPVPQILELVTGTAAGAAAGISLPTLVHTPLPLSGPVSLQTPVATIAPSPPVPAPTAATEAPIPPVPPVSPAA